MSACDTPHCREPAEELDDGSCLCDRCRDRAERSAWIDAREEEIRAAALANRWRMRLRDIADTGSRYYALDRDIGDDDIEELVVRLSDHASAHCREDWSVAMRPSGDDHRIEALLARLAEPAPREGAP